MYVYLFHPPQEMLGKNENYANVLALLIKKSPLIL